MRKMFPQHSRLPLTTQRIDSSTNKGLEQIASEVRKQVFCDNPVGMQGIIKTREKRVQSNYPEHIIRRPPVIYDARPRYHAP